MMKNFVLASLASLALIACASGGPFLTPQTAQAQIVQTNYVNQTNLVTVTNNVVQTTTNGVTVTNTVVQTNLVSVAVPMLVTNTVTVTNAYQVAAGVSNVIAGAQMVNGLTAPVNPYSGLISGVLAGGLGILGWYARLKTKQAQEHLSTAATIITAVENLAPTVGDGVKAAVAAQSAKMGTSATVNATVAAVTADLGKTS